MREDVSSSHLAEEDTFRRVVEKTGVVEWCFSLLPEPPA